MGFLSGSVVSAALNIGRGTTSFGNNTSSLCSRKPSSAHHIRAVTYELKILEEKIKSILQPKTQPFNKVLDKCYDLVPEELCNVLHKAHDIKQNLTSGALDPNDFGKLDHDIEEELRAIYHNLSLEAKFSKESLQNGIDAFMKLFGMIVLDPFSYVFIKYGDEKYELQDVNNSHFTLKTRIEMFRKYKDGFKGMVEKVVSEVKRDIKERYDELNEYRDNGLHPSICSLLVPFWKVQLFLKETNNSLTKITYLYKAEKEVLNFLEGLQEVMMGLIENYDHIQSYLEQMQLVSRIEDISRYELNDIKITNPRFIGAVNKLEQVIRSNIVLQRYRTAIDAFKQFVFPFASLYLHDLTPVNLNDEDAMARVVSQISSLQSNLQLYQQFVRNPSSYTAKKEFNSDYKYSTPFYAWNNSDHRSVIRHLLSGKEVLLKADVSGSPIGMDAIKFGMIGMEFKTRNRNLQCNFNEVLKNFKLRGVHLGNSYYRYDSKVYLIPTNSREFDFPFEMEENTGDILLSPYASWRFTLVNRADVADFEELSKYVEEIDLELIGNGFYVNWNEEHENGQYNDLDVDKYYKPLDKDGYNLC